MTPMQKLQRQQFEQYEKLIQQFLSVSTQLMALEAHMRQWQGAIDNMAAINNRTFPILAELARRVEALEKQGGAR